MTVVISIVSSPFSADDFLFIGHVLFCSPMLPIYLDPRSRSAQRHQSKINHMATDSAPGKQVINNHGLAQAGTTMTTWVAPSLRIKRFVFASQTLFVDMQRATLSLIFNADGQTRAGGFFLQVTHNIIIYGTTPKSSAPNLSLHTTCCYCCPHVIVFILAWCVPSKGGCVHRFIVESIKIIMHCHKAKQRRH